MRYTATIEITDYVCNPYTIEVYKVIQIQKESGVNRARSEAGRASALSAYLANIGMTLAEYEKLCQDAKDPVERNEEGAHIVPSEKVASMLVCANDVLPRAQQFTARGQERSRIATSDMTLVYDAEDVYQWERFAVVTQGSGAKASNQRGLRSDMVLGRATGTVSFEFSDQYVDPGKLQRALAYAGEHVGIGASRKMGKGRFTVVTYAKTK